jgi:eight-cysteine-cluster-containing protein
MMTRTILAALLFGALTACNAHQEAALEADASTSTVAAVEQAVDQAQEAAAEAPEVAEVAEVAEGVEPPEPPVDGPTPQLLYDQCHDRLEGPEVDGECAVDADCGTAGCSQEVCVPAAKTGDIITTCEILPCFSAKDACGCHEGRCTWSLKEQLAPALPRIPMKIVE